MGRSLLPMAVLQALLEYGAVGSSSWWSRLGSVRDNLLHWAATHPLELVLAVIGLLFLYKFLRP